MMCRLDSEVRRGFGCFDVYFMSFPCQAGVLFVHDGDADQYLPPEFDLLEMVAFTIHLN